MSPRTAPDSGVIGAKRSSVRLRDEATSKRDLFRICRVNPDSASSFLEYCA